MSKINITEFSHQLASEIINEGDTVLDGTAGNGHDTGFLAECVGSTGHVHAFDIQREAIENTRRKLIEDHLADRVSLHHASHADIKQLLPSNTELKLALFNLGYLPRGDKTITTLYETTLKALQSCLDMLLPGGRLIVVLYPGHDEGVKEYDAVLDWAGTLLQPYTHIKNEATQKRGPEIVFIDV